MRYPKKERGERWILTLKVEQRTVLLDIRRKRENASHQWADMNHANVVSALQIHIQENFWMHLLFLTKTCVAVENDSIWKPLVGKLVVLERPSAVLNKTNNQVFRIGTVVHGSLQPWLRCTRYENAYFVSIFKSRCVPLFMNVNPPDIFTGGPTEVVSVPKIESWHTGHEREWIKMRSFEFPTKK